MCDLNTLSSQGLQAVFTLKYHRIKDTVDKEQISLDKRYYVKKELLVSFYFHAVRENLQLTVYCCTFTGGVAFPGNEA